MGIMQRFHRGLLSFLLLLPLLPCNAAEQLDRYAPIHFQTDRWVYDDLKQVNTLTGHVILHKGTILIKADQIDVQRDPEGYQYIKASTNNGPQAYFRQKRTGLNEYIEGHGDTITYDDKSEVASLKHHARVSRLQGLTKVLDKVQGSVIRYDHARNIYSAESGNDSAYPGNPHGRVRAMLSAPSPQPRSSLTESEYENTSPLTPSGKITPSPFQPSATQP